MANRVLARKRAPSSVRARKVSAWAALRQAHDVAFDMEEPLRQAIWFIRTIEQANGRHDPQTEALSFVATEARLRLDTVEELWRKLFETET